MSHIAGRIRASVEGVKFEFRIETNTKITGLWNVKTYGFVGRYQHL
jgi:hypothetical protein